MPNKELNCHWVFSTQDDVDVKGPNNPTMMSFKDENFHSLVRESIQNSLDAHDDSGNPVIVSFAVRTIEGNEFPSFFDLGEHIKGCIRKFPVQGKPVFYPMLPYFSGLSHFSQELSYLRITDSNTKGMAYDVNDSNSGFYKFLAEGVAQDSEGAGGAFGFGKNAFWALSPISTVFVSSKFTDDSVYFAGIAKLCSHLIDDKLLAPYGKYTSTGNVVLSEMEQIPEPFRPLGVGTSVFVMGIESIDEDALIKSVLRNFWMAIYKNKLCVKVESTTIDRNCIDELMAQFFPLENDNLTNQYDYNPRVFYDIVVNAEKGTDGYKIITGPVTMDGKECESKLYVHLKDDAQGQIVFMRSQMMTIYTEKKNCNKAEGVFVCDSEDGNKFLRELEDYTHSSWNAKNYIARNHTNKRIATQAIKTYKTFIADSVKNEQNLEEQENAQVFGLEQLLCISTPEAVNDEAKKDEIIDIENIKDPKPEKKKRTKKDKHEIHQPRVTKAKFDLQGRLLSNSGGTRKMHQMHGPIVVGNQKGRSTETNDGKEGIYASPVDVSYRTWSQVESDGTVWHVIRIFSDKDIEKAIIQVFAVGEDGSKTGLDIVEAPGFIVRPGESFTDNADFDDSDAESKSKRKQVNNAVFGVRINANVPQTIKVRFNSNIKYSLCIDSDKIE